MKLTLHYHEMSTPEKIIKKLFRIFAISYYWEKLIEGISSKISTEFIKVVIHFSVVTVHICAGISFVKILKNEYHISDISNYMWVNI